MSYLVTGETASKLPACQRKRDVADVNVTGDGELPRSDLGAWH